jgi:hypothetical protein
VGARAGQEQLRARPRADMPGFVPWKTDLQRRAHLQKYRGIELRVRKAIRDGRKLNDSDAAAGLTSRHQTSSR